MSYFYDFDADIMEKLNTINRNRHHIRGLGISRSVLPWLASSYWRFGVS